MLNVDELISRFGSVRKMADALGVSPFTVYAWRRRGFLPDHYDLTLTERWPDITLEMLARMRAEARAAA